MLNGRLGSSDLSNIPATIHTWSTGRELAQGRHERAIERLRHRTEGEVRRTEVVHRGFGQYDELRRGRLVHQPRDDLEVGADIGGGRELDH